MNRIEIRNRKKIEKREKASTIFWATILLSCIGVVSLTPIGFLIFIIVAGRFFTIGGLIEILFVFLVCWGGLGSIFMDN